MGKRIINIDGEKIFELLGLDSEYKYINAQFDFNRQQFGILVENEKFSEVIPGDIIQTIEIPERNMNNVSDGYHTFGELYYHRMILFSIICKENKDNSWRSKLHADNTMYEGYFIVGIDTEKGQYSYHFDLKYWDKFSNIKTLQNAPEWDGHVPSDIERLLYIKDEN